MDADGQEPFHDWPDGEPVAWWRSSVDSQEWISQSDPRHCGFVRVGHEWHEFFSRTIRTAEGLVLVTSLYLVVTIQEAIADAQRHGFGPISEEPRDWGPAVPEKIHELMEGRHALVYRVSASEALWTGDFDGPLTKAIEYLRTELQTRSARELREIRMDRSYEWHIMPSERMDDELRCLELAELERESEVHPAPYESDGDMVDPGEHRD